MTSPASYTFGDFTVDTGLRKLACRGKSVPLPSRVFDVLVFLIEHRERPVQKEEIISAIWKKVVVTDDSLIHAISVLRRALADERRNPRFIETIPRRGYRFIGEVRLLADTAETDVSAAGHSVGQGEPGLASLPPPGSRHRSLPAMAGWVLAIGMVLFGITVILFPVNEAPLAGTDSRAGVHLFQPPPAGTSIVSGGVLSPNGRYIVFTARDDTSGQKTLWTKAMQTGEMWPLKGTAGAAKPFWSPDSRRLGFFADGRLMTTDINSETLQAVAPVAAAAGAAWGYDDRILFAEWSSGLYLVPASGDGNVETVMTLDRDAGDIAYSWPQFFPDSRRFIYQVASLDSGRTGAYVGDLESRQGYKLLDTTSPATFAPPRHLLYVQQDMLIAEEIDPQWLELTGRATVLARGITAPSHAAAAIVSASADLIAFEHGIRRQHIAWYDRNGAPLGSLNMPTVIYNPRISPDGEHLLASGSITEDPGLWLASLHREEFARLEHDAIAPVWSPDGRWIAYTSRGGFDIEIRSVDSGGRARLVASDDTVKILNDWTPDGRELVYARQDGDLGLDLWKIDVGTGTEEPLLATPFNETQARISPDGNWLAWASDESGTLDVYVARFPGLEDRRRVSVDGGGQPQWQADQSELFYLSSDRALMAVGMTSGAVPGFDLPRRLFRPTMPGDPGDARDFYAVGPGGDRFLIDTTDSREPAHGITVIVNWAEGLQGLAEVSPGSP